MVWFQVDDNLSFHRKTVEAGNSAMGLWVRAGAWSCQTLSDGYIPAQVARQLGSKREADRLVSCGLWAESLSENCRKIVGYQFHDWHQRQQTKSDVEARRQWERERKAAQRRRCPTGTQPNVPPGVPLDASPARAYPFPSLPTSTHLGEASPVASPTGEPPPMFCDEHMPHGTAEPCHACARQRHARDNWMASQDLNIKRVVQAEARANAQNRAIAIDNCELCDEDGYRPNMTVCDHIDHTITNANGAAAAREALNEIRARKANQ